MPTQAPQRPRPPAPKRKNKGCGCGLLIGLVCLAILAAATAYVMGWWIPQDTIRSLQSRGLLGQDTTDVAPDSALAILRPTLPEPDPPARQQPDVQPLPPPDVPLVEASESTERVSPTSTTRVELGAFPVYYLIQGEYRETTALNRVGVAVEIPGTWSASNHQMFDAQGNKVGEMGPGVFVYLDGTACSSRPPSEMDGPPDESRLVTLENFPVHYDRTASYCSGNEETYNGPCHVHSYCLQPANRPDGFGVEMTFLEFNESTSPTRREVFDQIMNSLRVRP